jgi:hypothetical protein
MPEWLHMSQPRYTRACQGQQMSEVVMARRVLTLKTIQGELKDDARPIIDQAVSSMETLYEFVKRAHEV